MTKLLAAKILRLLEILVFQFNYNYCHYNKNIYLHGNFSLPKLFKTTVKIMAEYWAIISIL